MEIQKTKNKAQHMISSCSSLREEPAELDERALWGRVLIVYVKYTEVMSEQLQQRFPCSLF